MLSTPISIVLPVYNGETYLRQCIEAVLHQDYTDFELLIGDDRSTDRSPEIIQEFNDPRIRCIRHERNLGLFGNLNRLIAAANTPLIRLLGQDDIVQPDCLTKTVVFFQQHPEVGMAFSRSIYIDQTGREIKRHVQDAFPEVIEPQFARQLFVYYGNIAGNISNVAFRRSVFDRVGEFSEEYGNAGDFEMWVRVAEHFPIGCIRRYLVQVRLHEQQLSRAGATPFDVVDANQRIYRRLIAQLPAAAQPHARAYVRRQQGVFWVHLAWRWLAAGKRDYFLQTVSTMGLSGFVASSFYWLLSLNKRLYRPQALIRVSDRSVRINLPRHRLIYVGEEGE